MDSSDATENAFDMNSPTCEVWDGTIYMIYNKKLISLAFLIRLDPHFRSWKQMHEPGTGWEHNVRMSARNLVLTVLRADAITNSTAVNLTLKDSL